MTSSSSTQDTSSSLSSKLRRISLPTNLLTKRSSHFLTPKSEFLKKISEFELGPPVSPSSSADNSDTSPMAASPPEPPVRPQSARLYRRQNRMSSPQKSPLNYTISWKDVDEFYGRKYSTALSEQLNITNDRIEANRGGDKERFSLSPASPRSLQSPIEENDGSPPPTHFKLGDSPWRNLGVEGYARNKGDEDDTLTEKEECDDNDNDPLPRMTGPRDFFMMKRSKNKCKAKFLRNFALDCPTGRVVDEGVKCIGGVLFRPEIAACKARRATCPEIILSNAEDMQHRSVIHCLAELHGSHNVGKRSVATMLEGCTNITESSPNGSAATGPDDKCIRFLINETEVEMTLMIMIQGRQNETMENTQCLTIYIVIYSISDRDSFINGTQTLYKLHENKNKKSLAVILVGNKADLQRKRRVSQVEGKMLAKIYHCPFIEVSSALCANKEKLWHEVLRRIYKHKFDKERQTFTNQSDVNMKNKLGQFLVDKTRRFAKSCEDWFTSRLVSTSSQQ